MTRRSRSPCERVRPKTRIVAHRRRPGRDKGTLSGRFAIESARQVGEVSARTLSRGQEYIMIRSVSPRQNPSTARRTCVVRLRRTVLHLYVDAIADFCFFDCKDTRVTRKTVYAAPRAGVSKRRPRDIVFDHDSRRMTAETIRRMRSYRHIYS